jgi:hypothetical protein
MRSLSPVAFLFLAGCGADPAYPPPVDIEARAAYIRAIRADLIESPPRHTVEGPTNLAPGDTPGAAGRKVGSVWLTEGERNARLDAQRRIASLMRIVVGECSWGSVDPDDVRPTGRDRVEGKVDAGYSCEYEVFHNTATRGQVSAKGRGFFFQRDGSFDFAGSEEGTFESARAATTPR